ncbi:MAG TPA: nucleotidyltransferase, partial [Bacteroidales bacterium]|nr:nucleotidyltransferase [Bacteroidales bacterium]
FKESYLAKLPPDLETAYVVQDIYAVPDGIQISPERKKPWGTGHAVLMAAAKISEPFAVINADDFYGRSAFSLMAGFLSGTNDNTYLEFCIAGYQIRNTLSDYGTVSRGVCETDQNGFLTDITERTKILRSGDDIVYLDDNGQQHKIPDSALVSMNLLGFSPGIFEYLERYFRAFLGENALNPGAEFYIPFAVNRMMNEGVARTRVLETSEKWFGVTYQEDRPHVKAMINRLTADGTYPPKLWTN